MADFCWVFIFFIRLHCSHKSGNRKHVDVVGISWKSTPATVPHPPCSIAISYCSTEEKNVNFTTTTIYLYTRVKSGHCTLWLRGLFILTAQSNCLLSHISAYGVWIKSLRRLFSSKTQGCKDFWKSSKPCHVGIHWKALIACSQMSTHVPGFQSFFSFFALFCIGQISHQQH